MATIALPFAASGVRRAPNTAELAAGFPCGPADIELFNWLNWWPTGQLSTFITKSGKVVDDTNLNRLAEAIRSHAMNWVTAVGGTANAITITLDPAPASNADLIGVPFFVRFSAANTITAPTISFNGLPPIAMARPGDSTLQPGDLQSGATCLIIYDGSVIRTLTLPKFGTTFGANWFRLPSGHVVQYGNGGSSAAGAIIITLPISYASAYKVFLTDESSPASPVGMSVFGSADYALSGFKVFGTRDFTNYTADSFNWFTIGV